MSTGEETGLKDEFHVTLADPQMYKNGVYSESIFLTKGIYNFRFIPNGDSPKVLTINLSGNSMFFSEDFELLGSLHETGISSYYTWDYTGEKVFEVQIDENLLITIDPHNNLKGPVSVYIGRN